MSVFDDARSVAESILVKLSDDDVRWRVEEVSDAGPVPPPLPGLPRDELVITIKSVPRGHRFSVHFATHLDFAGAVVATADQIQDGVVEARQGVALPPCPGHAHPLGVRLVDDEPTWVCPRSEQHHREPVLDDR